LLLAVSSVVQANDAVLAAIMTPVRACFNIDFI